MIDTERLLLREWRAEDAAAHHALCADPRVAATLGPPPSLGASAAVVERQNGFLARHGYCFWVAECRASGTMIGWCGIKPGTPPIEGEAEIGWTLASDRWGQGLAYEAAVACLAWAWTATDLPAIVAITSAGNHRSAALMARLGMVRRPAEDFDHPDLAAGDPLRAHVVYRIGRPA